MDISIVTTVYRSEPYIMDFYNRISATVKTLTSNYEIIFVNDGSPDNSLNVLLSLYEKDSKIKIVDLAKNFGHHKAIMSGLTHAEGRLIFLIDSDLEEEPELLIDFFNKLKETNADMVFGVQKRRKGKWFERFTGHVFHKIFNMLSKEKVVPNQGIIRLMTYRFVQSLIRHREQTLYFGGLVKVTGFEQVPFIINKGYKGSSTYSFVLKVTQTVNAITAFSDKPLIIIFNTGCLISAISFFWSIYLILTHFIYGTSVVGWTSLILSIWLIGGLIILFLGVIGIYLSKVFIEVKNRPYAIIRDIYQNSKINYKNREHISDENG